MNTETAQLVSIDTIRAAAARIAPIAIKTPLVRAAFPGVSGYGTGREIWLKAESLQPIGAFKIRGASNLILSLPDAALARGIVTYSSGNHAQAVAIASKHVGAQATIVMPEDAPKSKLEATRAQGAKIVTYNRRTETRETIAAEILQETGATLVPPFDHPMIMAGQGTAAMELLEETGPLDALMKSRRRRERSVIRVQFLYNTANRHESFGAICCQKTIMNCASIAYEFHRWRLAGVYKISPSFRASCSCGMLCRA